MYIPGFNSMERPEMIDFIKKYYFGTIVTCNDDNIPLATNLPFFIDYSNDVVTIQGHFSKANEQWKFVQQKKSLVLFNGPHAYISPANYVTQNTVPTWNYITVHAYGNCSLVTDEEGVFKHLHSLIGITEPGYYESWEKMPVEIKKKMMAGISVFEMKVDDLLGKKKLSQNKKVEERENIINSLMGSINTNDIDTAQYMKKDLDLL